MSIFSSWQQLRVRADEHVKSSLTSDLYARYVVVVVILIVLVAAIQFESLHSALVVANENNLSFAMRDALSEAAIDEGVSAQSFVKAAPRILTSLSLRGINVRLYDEHLHLIGKRLSRFDPVDLVTLRPHLFALMSQNQTRISQNTTGYVTQSHGQMLLLGIVSTAGHVVGYVELGYSESLLYPMLLQQALRFFMISLFVVIFTAMILIPIIRKPLRPLNRLFETAERIKAGEFHERLPVIGTFETVHLAEMINDALDLMANSVKKEKEATDRMKQFVSDASHELRTPLTAIRGFADVLLRRLDSYVEELKTIQCDGQADGVMTEDVVTRLAQNTEKIAGMRLGLRTMQQETARLEELVRDLLQLAKLEENLTPQLEQVEMAALVQSLQPQFQLLAGARQIIYDLAQVVVACDRSMLQQILYNVVTNAIQHTDPEYGIVQIRLRSSKKKGALLMVSDNGPGIAKEQVERIFDRFYRASGSRDRNPGGAGLGLAIVAEIVRVHEGRIWAESEQGAGTTMFVEL